VKQMQKFEPTITFTCPGCKETFEFDMVEEYQLVPCPLCGIDYITIRKNQTLLLKCFEFNSENAEEKTETAPTVE
jgi:hypothetical protein